MLAEACFVHNVPYIAWCYDSPSYTGPHWYLFYPTTHVFTCDSDDAAHYKEGGIEQAHYMPLAVSTEYFEGIACTEADKAKYASEISFVGSLYDSSLPKAMSYLTDYQKAYLMALMDNQMDVYGHSFLPGLISPKFMDWLDEPKFNKAINSDFEKEKAKGDTAAAGKLQLLMNKQITNRERQLLLNLLAKYHEVKLYSYKNSEALHGLTFCGAADYYVEMPKIFRHSKINLNATMRSIQNGIPLRCLDVMACHGLLLTNYQKDFDDHFKDGENVLFYTNAEEALEKANFYLAHDTLREKIAEAGYQTVKKYYNYPDKIREMLELAKLDYLIPKERRQAK
jgi:spore maturation protein CgeB